MGQGQRGWGVNIKVSVLMLFERAPEDEQVEKTHVNLTLHPKDITYLG